MFRITLDTFWIPIRTTFPESDRIYIDSLKHHTAVTANWNDRKFWNENWLKLWVAFFILLLQQQLKRAKNNLQAFLDLSDMSNTAAKALNLDSNLWRVATNGVIGCHNYRSSSPLNKALIEKGRERGGRGSEGDREKTKLSWVYGQLLCEHVLKARDWNLQSNRDSASRYGNTTHVR